LNQYLVGEFLYDQIKDTEHENYILAKWLRSLRYGNDHYRYAAPHEYYRDYQDLIRGIMEDEACRIRFACLADDEDILLGFSVYRDKILDYVYVQKDMRRIGIGSTLLPKGIKQISHLTKTGVKIWEKKYGHWIFNPFA